MRFSTRVWLCALVAFCPVPAWAWGDEGHEITGVVALHFLAPAVREKVDALLAADTDTLTAPDFVSRTTWADRYRDSDRNTTKLRYNATEAWHFVDLELSRPNLDEACFGFPKLGEGQVASTGPAQDCVVDKIEEFSRELGSPTTPQAERVLALKFLMHFVGDLHQPLHASDNHDHGGNDVMVLRDDRRTAERLHGYWDTDVVQRLGRDPQTVGRDLIADADVQQDSLSKGTPHDWANESFAVARDVAYALPSTTEPDERGTPAYHLSVGYERNATAAARLQLARAGVRLAGLLNAALR